VVVEMDKFEKMSGYLQKGNMKEVVRISNELIEEGAQASEILGALLGGMGIIGEKFKNNEVFVPEVLIAARAMNGGLSVIRPLLEQQGVESMGKVVIGTVKGDLHDIGKNLVSMMMVGAGFDVIDLGVDVPTEKYIQAITENKADILCMSALLTTTMPMMKTVIEAIEEKGLRNSVKIMIGGAPVTESYAQEIGADLYTADASTAATEAKKLVSA
jgi:5-methyltetrahydrofolate--homocysteine methyltransferase